MHSGDNYRVTAPEGPRQTPPRDRPHRLAHEHQFRVTTVATDAALFDVYSALPTDDDDESTTASCGGEAGSVARPAAQCVASSQQRCADRKSLIRVSPRSLTKDPRRWTLAICILQSAVRPHLNATPIAYSQYK